MKVTISSLCSGHGRCYSLHPDVYAPDDLGYEEHREGSFEVSERLEESARAGARGCPERAIAIEES